MFICFKWRNRKFLRILNITAIKIFWTYYFIYVIDQEWAKVNLKFWPLPPVNPLMITKIQSLPANMDLLWFLTSILLISWPILIGKESQKELSMRKEVLLMASSKLLMMSLNTPKQRCSTPSGKLLLSSQDSLQSQERRDQLTLQETQEVNFEIMLGFAIKFYTE